ncbi:uncharacterized protein LOC110313408 [Mus pahari]|uniref:uncharacterized protein LOC110313408 n=1 Tax=Mus pahari TaxID=10093 RepID=UPI00111501BB|nr:uncharacterized protein LOC110313408 [Mus pahari]
MAAAGGCRRACALGVPELQAGGWGRGASWSAAELQPPPQLPPQRRGHVVWCVGRGEEEEGVKPSEETAETPHTAQDGRRGSSSPSCQAACRGPRARRCAGSRTPAARRALGERGGRGWGEAAARECGSSRPERPGRPGPTTPVAPLRQRRRRWRARLGGGFAPWAGGCGGRPVLDTRGRASRWRLRSRFDPVTYKMIIHVVADDSEYTQLLSQECESLNGMKSLYHRHRSLYTPLEEFEMDFTTEIKMAAHYGELRKMD